MRYKAAYWMDNNVQYNKKLRIKRLVKLHRKI